MVKLFIQKHAAVFSAAVLIVIMGIMSYISLPRESMPELKQPMIFVTTTYPGVSAKDMENLVTRVIEEEIEGLEGLDVISSVSQQSLSFINVEFTSNIDVETALRKVRERVDIAKSELPIDVDQPMVKELSSSDWPIYTMVMSHPDGIEKIDKAATLLEEEIKRIRGVLDVDVYGQLQKEVIIEIDPMKLEKYNFSMNDITKAVQSENASIPGGMLKNRVKNYSLSVTGEMKDPAQFNDIIVSARGVKVPLRELGTASLTWKDPETYSRINGVSCISISITKRSGENIIHIVDRVKERLEELQPKFPAETKILESYDGALEIKDMVLDLENNIFSALVLVLIVTIFFIGGVNAIFVSLAIPFSMLMSFSVLQMMGITLNMIVLFSLVIALGMLVDNGIVIVENIFRHAAMGKSRKEAALEGASEVAGPITASTITTCLAFFPIIFMPGIMGDILSYLPITVIIVLASSLLVALSINPVFCASFMKISEKNMKKMSEGSGAFQKFQGAYGTIVRKVANHPLIALLFTTIFVFAGFFAYGARGKEAIFFPTMDPSSGIVAIDVSQGTPLDITDKYIKRAEAIVKNAPGASSTKNYVATTGQGAGDGMSVGSAENHKGYVRINYKAFLERKLSSSDAIDSLNAKLKEFMGANVSVKAIEGGPPTGNDISFKITGNSYDTLGALADSTLAILKEYGELKIVDSDFEAARPEIQVDIDREKAAFFGVSTQSVASAIRSAINGSIIGKYREGKDEYDITIKYTKPYRGTIADLTSIHIMNRDDERIPLSSIASITPKTTIGVIKRKDLERTVEVWADFFAETANAKVLTAEINKKVAALNIPNGYTIGSGEGAEVRQEAGAFLVKAFIVAIFLIFIVLIAQFNSITEPFIIMVAVLFSFSGVFWGYALAGMNFVVIMSGIGCIALAGVVVNNCIVLIDYTNILKDEGMEYHEAIIESGKTRLRPVLLTAITTILGMAPMAMGISFDVHKFTIIWGSESGQMWVPFAWAMIFGLGFATVLTLVLVPALLSLNYKIFKRVRKIRKKPIPFTEEEEVEDVIMPQM